MVKRNKVKLCILMTVLAAVCIVTLILLQTLYKYRKYDESGIPDAVSSSYDGRECRLIVTANSSEIEDREQFAREVFRMCRENSFRTIKLSTDIQGWPERLDITVYFHRRDIGEKESAMRIRFVPPDDGETYDIKSNPGAYEILIE